MRFLIWTVFAVVACGPNASQRLVAQDVSLGEPTLTDHWQFVIPLGSRRVANDPYASVDWDTVQSLKTQFHDHTLDWDRIQVYDRAGYHAVSLFNYSGRRFLRNNWTERHWPVEDWLPEGFREELTNVKILFANAEEAGPQHFTSPFLEDYIEYRFNGQDPKLSYHYDTTIEGFDLIRELGGLPFLAHPWGCCDYLNRQPNGPSYHAVEIYSALFESSAEDYPMAHEHFLQFWHRTLLEKPMVYGVAVNDHFGPVEEGPVADSGKTLVLSSEPTLAEFRHAVEAGAMFAVKDFGAVKDQYPQVERISVFDQAIEITLASEGNVTWVAGHADGQDTFDGNVLDLSQLDTSYQYVRAQIDNEDGSAVFTQPWALRSEDDDGFNVTVQWLDGLSNRPTPLIRPSHAAPMRMDMQFAWTDELPGRTETREHEIYLRNAVSMVGTPSLLVDGEETADVPHIDDTGAIVFPVGHLQPGTHTIAVAWPQLGTFELGSFAVALAGDANLDDQFDQLDLIQMLQANKFLAGELALWEDGDFDGDRQFSSLDLVSALAHASYRAKDAALQAPMQVVVVPEPSAFLLLAIGGGVMVLHLMAHGLSTKATTRIP